MARWLGNARLEVIVADITTLRVDAIVNAANSSLLGGGGVDGAIHRAAGPELLAECRTLRGCATGTPRSHMVIGFPLGMSSTPSDRSGMVAVNAKMNCLPPAIAGRSSSVRRTGLGSLAFPAISTGVYRFPADRAAGISVGTVAEGLASAPAISRVIFCCFSDASARLHEQALAGFDGPCAG
jgi:O-acetyl-ADP-ribose deacetylase